MKNKINIFFFISSFNYGGASNAILTFLKNLNFKKYNIHLIINQKSDYKKNIPKYINFKRVKTKQKSFKTFFSFFEIKRLVSKSIKNHEKNIFISNIHFSNVLTILFLRHLKNLKIILFERTSLSELDINNNIISFLKNKIIKLLIYFTYPLADQIAVNSKALLKELYVYNLTSKVVYSGSLKFIQKKKKKFKKKKKYTFISVGRLTYQKDYETLLKAVILIRDKNFILKIFGKGELLSKLKKKIRDYKLNKIVKIIGHEKNKNKIYNQADLLIHTSIFEGMPNVLVEAMNYNIPIISSDCPGGTKELLLSGKYGDLFNPGDYNELAIKINNFMSNPKKLQKKILKSKKKLKKFTYKMSTKSLEKIIENMY